MRDVDHHDDSARELYSVFDGLPAGFVTLDRGGRALRVTEHAALQLGATRSDLEGKDFFRELLPSLEESGLGERFRSATPGEEAPESVEVSHSAAGVDRLLCVHLRPVRLGEFAGGIAFLTDRTSLNEEEKQRKRAESLASVGELVAGLAHEVNNPLASIKSFAQLLSREASTGEQRHALDLISQECNRIGRAVENVVSFARQQGASGREPVNLSNLVERVIQVRRYSLEAAGVEVRLDLDASISPVMGEPGALQQVILNLVNRAEKDLALRRSERMLIVRTRESSEGVVLYVVDNGPGISREALPRLFDPYAAAAEGHGTELSTSARIVRDHGGYVLAESEPGRGSAFFVRLPRAGAPPISAPQGTEMPAAPSPARALHVLVADDEPTLRLAITLFLNRRGHRVSQASDAYEALRLAKQEKFDVALVDARMPGDGLVLLEQLEEMPGLTGRTALMTGDLGQARTSNGLPSDRPYLIKPFDMNEAVQLIEKLAELEKN